MSQKRQALGSNEFDSDDSRPTSDSKKIENEHVLLNNRSKRSRTIPGHRSSSCTRNKTPSSSSTSSKSESTESESDHEQPCCSSSIKSANKSKKQVVIWKSLIHKGPVFAPEYARLPGHIHFKYDRSNFKLCSKAEEVACFYSKLIEHDCTTRAKFKKNFMEDWRQVMTKTEQSKITDLRLCDFTEINQYYKDQTQNKKNMSKEDKGLLKEAKEKIEDEFGYCMIDGRKEKIGNFRVEPPGLFQGRGDNPKMGKLKDRVLPEQVVINCSKDSIPTAPSGHAWKEVRHDKTVSWLACWKENISGSTKYVWLGPASKLKGGKDLEKFEKARRLGENIVKIRKQYTADFESDDMKTRQIAVAMYFIDKLALRAGNEKGEDEADTVGCCSLRCEHVNLIDKEGEIENLVEFDFLGKDSVRYYRKVPVERIVYDNLKQFKRKKEDDEDLFDELSTTILNGHLKKLMPGLSAKVFRTYNASHTLQEELDERTKCGSTDADKRLAYKRANRAVAVLCNHQRSVPKSHEKSMEGLETKIKNKKADIAKANTELKALRTGTKEYDKKKSCLDPLKTQLTKLEVNETDKKEGKEIALGTSKLNYLDPRISVAWCKKHSIEIEKIYSKTERAKFGWALDNCKDFQF